MKLTWASEYAILGMLHLSRVPVGKSLLLASISEKEDIPESFLRKIFGTLAKSGLLRSHRGPQGGFSLLRPPEQISLRQIVEAVEGPIAFTECILGPNICSRQGRCPIEVHCQDIHRRMVEIMDQTSMADIATDKGNKSRVAGKN